MAAEGPEGVDGRHEGAGPRPPSPPNDRERPASGDGDKDQYQVASLGGPYFTEKGGEMVPRGREDQKDTRLPRTPYSRASVRAGRKREHSAKRRRSIGGFSDDRSCVPEAPLGGLEVVCGGSGFC